MTTPPPHPAAASTPPYHLAGSLARLVAEVNAHWPKRSKASDGGIGDERHQAEGAGSDHNPWLNHTVRAYDLTAEGINAPWFAEELRKLGQSGDVRLVGGGYVIWDHHVTSEDFTHWVPYTGDPHTTHVHVSVSRNPSGYEYSGPWSFLESTPLHPPKQPQHPEHPEPAHTGPHHGNEAPQAPAPLNVPVVVEPGFPAPGSDGVGTGAGFRAQIGDEGPAIKHLQAELNRMFPLYSDLVVDGDYGPETAAVIAEFAQRVSVGDPNCPEDDRDDLANADGETIGPRIAAAFTRFGVHL